MRAPGELRFLHRRALAAAGAVIEEAGADDLDEAVEAVVRTVTEGNLWTAEVLSRRSLARDDRMVPAAAYGRSAELVDTAACRLDVLTQRITTPEGTVTGADLLADRFVAVWTAGRAIAAAAGVGVADDPGLVDAAIGLVVTGTVPVVISRPGPISIPRGL